MSYYTRGPWEVSFWHDMRGYPGFYINGMSGDEKSDLAVIRANARLIAAAPELLEALNAALDSANELELSSVHFPRERIRQAVAKATGVPQ